MRKDIKITQVAKTSDGKLFEDEVEARTHQESLNIRQEYRESPLCADYGEEEVEFDTLLEWVRNNQTFVRALLNFHSAK